MFGELNYYLDDCRSRNLSDRTIKSYKNNALLFLNTLNQQKGITDVDQIKKVHVLNYFAELQKNGKKTTYINGIHKVLKSFFEWLLEEEYTTTNPIAKVKWMKEEKTIKKTLQNKEIKNIFNYYDGDDFLSIRNKTLIAIQVDTGIRCSETCDILNGDLFDDRILIKGKGNKQRMVYVSPILKKLIKKYTRARKDYFKNKTYPIADNLFLSFRGKRLTVEAVERVYRIAKKETNITRDIRVSPHTSRHTFASNMIENNDIYVVSKMLGHTHVSTTEIYLGSIDSNAVIDKVKIVSPLSKMR